MGFKKLDPVALEGEFELYLEGKAVVTAHLYGTPGKGTSFGLVCERYRAVIIEDVVSFLGRLIRKFRQALLVHTMQSPLMEISSLR